MLSVDCVFVSFLKHDPSSSSLFQSALLQQILMDRMFLANKSFRAVVFPVNRLNTCTAHHPLPLRRSVVWLQAQKAIETMSVKEKSGANSGGISQYDGITISPYRNIALGFVQPSAEIARHIHSIIFHTMISHTRFRLISDVLARSFVMIISLIFS